MTRALAAALAAVLALAGLAPAAAAQPDVSGQYVDLQIIASPSAPAYTEGERVDVTVSIINNGTVTANDVVVRSEGDLALAPWAKLEPGAGIQLGPGERTDITVHAWTNDTGGGMTQHLEAASAGPERDPADNETTVFAFVTEKHADLDLTVFTDGDRDGVVDPGEARTGIEVTLSGGLGATNVTTRTDDHGVAHFLGIPGGVYQPSLAEPGGWYMDPDARVNVRGGANEERIQLLPDNISALRASVSLDEDTYAPLEQVRERVTLTNTGTTDIHGVMAFCGGYGAGQVENALFSVGWGELYANEGPGATIRAGETRTWEFTDVVPSLAWNYGYVFLRCDFSRQGDHNGPVAEDRAAVPGGHGVIAGTLTTEAGARLPGVTMLMLGPSGGVAGRAESGPDGRFQFGELPADVYELRPVGRWKLPGTSFTVQVWAGRVHDLGTLVLSVGPYLGDPDAPPPPPSEEEDPGTPAPRASPRSAGLADTGADVVELIALGALLVVAGVLLRRRVA